MWRYVIQVMCSLWFFTIHFVPLAPLNDIELFPNASSWVRVLALNVIIQQLLLLGQVIDVPAAVFCAACYWGLLLIGHINTWWLPYLVGWPKTFVDEVVIDRRATLRFLPARGNRPVPDVAYCVLGVLALGAFLACIW